MRRKRHPAPRAGSARNAGESPVLRRFLDSPWPPILFTLLAVALRLIHLDQMARYGEFRVPLADESRWIQLGRRVASGDWRLIDWTGLSPGYPWMLGLLLRIAGDDILRLRLLQALMSALVPLPVGLLTRRLLGPVDGLFAGLLAATWGPAVFLGAHLNESTLALLFLSTSLAILVRHLDRPGIPAISTSGLLAGLAVMTQPLAVLAPLVFVPTLMFHRKLKIAVKTAVISAFALGLSLGISPAALRLGWADRLLPAVTKSFEEAILKGWGSGSPAGFDLPMDPGPGIGEASKPRGVQHGPGRTIVDLVRRAGLAIHRGESPGPFSHESERRRSWVLRLPFPGFGLLFPLAVLGIAALRRERKLTGLRLSGALLLALLFAPVPFYLSARFRILALPLLLPIAFHGLRQVMRAAREPDIRPLLVPAGTAVLVALVGRLPADPAPHAAVASRLAAAAAAAGLPSDADRFSLEAKRLGAPRGRPSIPP